MHGFHFGVVVHFGNGVEEIDFLAKAKGIAHFQKSVSANIPLDAFFSVIKNQNSFGILNFLKVFTDKVILNFGGDAFVIAFHEVFIEFGVVHFDRDMNGVTKGFKKSFGRTHFLKKLHAATDCNNHGEIIARCVNSLKCLDWRGIVYGVITYLRSYSMYVPAQG